jgi:transcriptional regulator GlxA family with amidase domain
MACCRTFAAVVSARQELPDAGALANMRESLFRAGQPVARLDPVVQDVLTLLHTAGRHIFWLSEANLAARAHVHPAHLGRLIHSQTGLSIVEWRWGIALRPAVHLVAETTLSMKEIAFHCGFTGPETFRRCFSAVLGMAPSSLRHRLR